MILLFILFLIIIILTISNIYIYYKIPKKKGSTGLRGIKGDKGNKGEFGILGYSGNVGFKGYKGNVGPQIGIDGSRGLSGINGVNGMPGLVGSKGAPGVPGIKGDGGLQGEKGFSGKKGLQGKIGPNRIIPKLDPLRLMADRRKCIRIPATGAEMKCDKNMAIFEIETKKINRKKLENKIESIVCCNIQLENALDLTYTSTLRFYTTLFGKFQSMQMLLLMLSSEPKSPEEIEYINNRINELDSTYNNQCNTESRKKQKKCVNLNLEIIFYKNEMESTDPINKKAIFKQKSVELLGKDMADALFSYSEEELKILLEKIKLINELQLLNKSRRDIPENNYLRTYSQTEINDLIQYTDNEINDIRDISNSITSYEFYILSLFTFIKDEKKILDETMIFPKNNIVELENYLEDYLNNT